MYRKIRKRLTLLSGTIVTIIFIVMTLGYLKISENNLTQSKLIAIENDIRSVASSLESQIVISNSWLSELSTNGNYEISIMDNHSEFYFNKINLYNNQELLNTLWNEYHTLQNHLPRTVLSYQNYYKKFDYNGGLCYVLTYGKNESLEILVYSSMEEVRIQLKQQRMIFLSIIIIALILIWLFSWFFIGKLLKPIEESQLRQNNFIASASHELRTPLAVIISCTEDLLANSSSDNKSNDTIEVIQKESFRMSSMLTDMLTLSSKDSGHFELNKTEVELDTLLLNVYESFETMMQKKSLSCSLTLPEDSILPYKCDKDKIYQLLAILIHNAVSYTPEKGHIDISLKAQQEKKTSYLIEVADNGPGISDEDKCKIFDRFYRSESSRSSKGHFGLGLAIAHEIVNAHGGSIEVFDTDVINKCGARFVVKI